MSRTGDETGHRAGLVRGGQGSNKPDGGLLHCERRRKLLSLGYHSVFGGEHAEVHALKKLKEQNSLKGATVFVTLEPCSHVGQTPSCAYMLSQLPIKAVIYGCKDPNPIASGGRKILSRQGILSKKYVGLGQELGELNEVFLYNVQHQRAFVALKVATGLDGSLALKNGQSQWITNEASRKRAHELRARYNATLIGVQTYFKDNPKLNIRDSKYKGYRNKVIILDPRGQSLETLEESNLLKVHHPEDIYIVTMEKVKSRLGVHFHVVQKSSSIDLKALSRDLYSHFLISSVLVEGGAITHSHFINQKGAQKLYQFIAPVIMGGVNWVQNVRVRSMEDKVGVEIRKIENLEDNVLVVGNFIEPYSNQT